MKSDRWLWGILVLGAAVRLAGIGGRSLSYDECQQFWASRGNVLISNRDITLDPPGFAYLLNLDARVGQGETWLRLLPCLFGILGIAAVYRLALVCTADRFTARAAAFCIALAPYPIRYSQSLRVYSQAIFFAAALVATFVEAEYSQEAPGWKRATLLAFFTFAALLSVYGSVWIVLVLAALAAGRAVAHRGGRWRRSLAALGAGTMLAVPFYLLSLPVQLSQGTPSTFYEDKFMPGAFLPALRFVLGGTWDLFDFFSFLQPWTGLFFGALFVLGMIRLRRGGSGAVLQIVFIGCLALAAAASAFRLYTYGGTRQMLFAAPPFYVLCAAGIGSLRQRLRGWPAMFSLAAILCGSGIFLYRYHTEPGGQEMRPVVRGLQERLHPGDRILVNRDARPQFKFYYHGDPRQVVWGQESVIRDYLSEASRVMDGAPRARWWLVFSHGWSAARRQELTAIDPRFAEGERIEAYRAGAYLFVPRDDGPASTGEGKTP